MGINRRTRRSPLQAAIGMLMLAVLALGLMPLPAFAAAGEGRGAPAAPGIAAATGLEAGDAQGAGAPEGGPGQLTAAPGIAAAPGGTPLGAQDESHLYAVFDSTIGSLTFKRETGTYANGQEVGTLTYYTGVEDKEYSSNEQPLWIAKYNFIKKVDFQTAVAPISCAFWFYGCKNLKEVRGAGRLDTSGVKSMRRMFSGCPKLASLDVSKWDTSKVADMAYMFNGCSSLASLDVSGWVISGVMNMEFMFSGCPKLASLDVSKWDTSKVADMRALFSGCSELASLDVSGWDTSKVADMGYMFQDCSSLASLDVSGWDTSQAKNMANVFFGCSELASLDVSGWDTSKVRDMGYMFYSCSKLDFLDVSGWDTSKAAYMQDMFSGCSSLSSVRLGGKFSFKGAATSSSEYAVLPDAPDGLGCASRWINESVPGARGVTAADLRDNYPDAADSDYAPGTYAWEGTTKAAVFDSEGGSLTFMRAAGAYSDGQVDGTRTYYTGFEDKEYSLNAKPSWLARAADIKTVDFQATVAPRSCAYWFYDCQKLARVLDAGRLTVSGAASMERMFHYCRELASLDVSGWKTWKVGDMDSMFMGCTKLSSVKLGGGFSFRSSAPSSRYAALPDAPNDAAHTGKWINSSEPGAQGVTAADLRDNYPDITEPSFAPGTYVWEVCGDISAAKVSAPDQVYTGKALTPAPKVALGGKTLAAGTDYTVSYRDNVNAGTATVTVTGKGKYAGSANATFEIKRASIAKAKVVLAKTSYTYDGRAKKPAVKVELNGKALAAGTDYEVAYKDNVKLGAATATATGKGNYTGSAKATFTIKLGRVKALTFGHIKAKSIDVSWAEVAGAKGYQIQWRKRGGKWKAAPAKSTSTTVKGLKRGGIYDLRVRAVSGKAKGAWSAQAGRWLQGQAGVKAASKKPGTVKASWRKTAKANAGYLVVVRYSKGGKAVAKQRVETGKTKATVKGLEPGKRAWVHVRALRKAGGATYSGVLTRAKRPVTVAG